MKIGEHLSKWRRRRLRVYFYAFVPPPLDANCSAEPLKLTAGEVVRIYQHDRSALFGRNIEISTPRIDQIVPRDSIEMSLRIARAREVIWLDATGRREPWKP